MFSILKVWLVCGGFRKVEIQPAFSHRERKPGWPRCSVTDMRPTFSHAKFNTHETRVYVCVCWDRDDLLLVANYTCQRCFSLPLEQEAKVTTPGRHVTPTETVFGFTGNFYCHMVSRRLVGSFHPTVAGYVASSGPPVVHLGHFSQSKGGNVTLNSLKLLFHRIEVYIEVEQSRFSCLRKSSLKVWYILGIFVVNLCCLVHTFWRSIIVLSEIWLQAFYCIPKGNCWILVDVF